MGAMMALASLDCGMIELINMCKVFSTIVRTRAQQRAMVDTMCYLLLNCLAVYLVHRKSSVIAVIIFSISVSKFLSSPSSKS